jgi:methionine-rich copper-binding protein CopC
MPVRSFLRSASLRLCVSVLLAFGIARTASAHAIILESTPTVDSTVAGPDVDIKLTYNSRIDLTRSRLQLELPTGEKQNLVIAPESGPAIVISKASALKPGAYHLRWQVLSVDGHITRGDIPFKVSGD